jgi:hypothetical protein
MNANHSFEKSNLGPKLIVHLDIRKPIDLNDQVAALMTRLHRMRVYSVWTSAT